MAKESPTLANKKDQRSLKLSVVTNGNRVAKLLDQRVAVCGWWTQCRRRPADTAFVRA